MAERSLRYRIAGATWSLEVPAQALSFLVAQAQHDRRTKESVGQIFTADAAREPVSIDVTSKLPPRRAGRAGVQLNLEAVNRQRELMFEKGLHCLGFWHTHPEPIPSYSPDDLAMAADHARAAKSQFTGLVFIIVGTAPLPSGLGVWVHDGTSMWRAELVSTDSQEGSANPLPSLGCNDKQHAVARSSESS
jgi:hypothetical protein